jgi:hypothetical protein
MTHPVFLRDEVIVYDDLVRGAMKKRETIFGTIYFDLEVGHVHFIQRWKYHFELDQRWVPKHQTAASWGNDEECNFHIAATTLIWKFWDSSPKLPLGSDPSLFGIVNLLNSNRSTLSIAVTGTGELAKKFSGRKLDIDFDVAISVSRPHYFVNVKKMLPGHELRSFVDYNNRTINLAKQDIETTSVQQEGRNPATNDQFVTLPHEFGHAIGYGTDEYTAGAGKRKDIDSLMNIGRETRPRHLRFIQDQLNQMFPGTQFAIS